MADTVRYMMEGMIPELEDLEQRGYFTKEEVKQVVKKRMHFEYLLKRMAAVKNDFLRYAEYEMKLEELRALRKETMGITGKRTLADYAIVRRVHFIFERATRKFRGDMRLWMRWLEYCKASNSPRQTSKVLTKALQLHPNAAGLWSYAASWEFEHNSNAAAARALMQRGLRMCKGSEQLWAEYFRLELLYVHRLRARRQVLGIHDSTDAAQAGDGTQPAADSDAAPARAASDAQNGGEHPAKRAKLNGGSARRRVRDPNASSSDDSEASDADEDPLAQHPVVLPSEAPSAGPDKQRGQPPQESDAAIKAVLTGAVARVVYRNAVAAVPGSTAFRRRLLDMLEPFDFPGAEGLRDEIIQGIAADFADQEDAWDLRARWAFDAAAARDEAGARKAAVALYQDAIGRLPTPKMYDLFTAFLTEQLQQQRRDAEGEGEQASKQAAQVAADQLTGQLLAAYEQAHAAGVASEDSLLSWPRVALDGGRDAEAAAAVEAGVQAMPSSGRLWQQRLAIHIQHMAAQSRHKPKKRKSGGKAAADPAPSPEQQAAALEDLALRAVRPTDAAGLWMTVLQAFAATNWPCQRLLDHLVATLWSRAKGPVEGGLASVACTAVDLVAAQDGIDAARCLYQRMLKGPSPGGAFFRHIIALEQAQGEAGAEQSKRVKRLFEAAVDSHGQEDVELWVHYAKYEQQQNRGAGSIYWRATKTLSDSEPFIAACRSQSIA